MESLEQERAKLDSIDDRILGLVNERLLAAGRIGAIKRTVGKAISDPGRENSVLNRLKGNNPGPMSDDDIEAIWRMLFAMSRKEQSR